MREREGRMAFCDFLDLRRSLYLLRTAVLHLAFGRKFGHVTVTAATSASEDQMVYVM